MLLEISNVSKNYGAKKVLNDINLQIKKGKIVGLLGPNGCGKTTLIKLINGLLIPTSGTILVHGKDVGIESKKIISYLPDKNYLNNNMNVRQLFEFFSDFYTDFSLEKARNLLRELDISETDKFKTMSKGTKEKVQLILVMSRKADLYVLDEPIGGIDPASRDYILNTILKNYNKDASVIITTHLIADIESILDEVVFIKNGEILLHKDKEELIGKSKKTVDEIFREEYKC